MTIQRFLSSVCALVVLVQSSAIVQSQDCNNGVCGKISNAGTIRFTKKSAQFRNAGPTSNVNNDQGVIEFRGTTSAFSGAQPLGSSTASRIGGWVVWTATDSNQIVQPRYFTNLGVSGLNKFIGDSCFVAGAYRVDAGTGRRLYNGLFCYDGTRQQSIVAEHGLNSYDKLELQNALSANTKTLSADTATVRGLFLNNKNNIGGLDVRTGGVLNLLSNGVSSALLSVHGDTSRILVNTNASQLILKDSSTMLADNGGRVDVNSTYQPAAFIIQEGSSFRINAGGNGGQYHLFANTAMNVEGYYVNIYPALTNAYYECSSTVRYISQINGQNLQASASPVANRYGKLETIGANKLANGNVYIKCGFWVNPGTRPHTVTIPKNNSLFVYNENYALTPVQYDTAATDCQTQSEVIGNFVQMVPSDISARSLTFNNRLTTLSFSDHTGVPQSFGINSQPNTDPNNFVAASDVKRKLTVSYTNPQSGSAQWKARIQAAFRESECSTLRASRLLGAVRTFNDPTSGSPNKIGVAYNRSVDSSCILHWVSAEEISHSGSNTLASGNDLLLRSAPSVIYSVRPGRWSNPATWSDRTEPFPFDSVVVYHNVWAGFTRPLSNGWDGYSTAEAFPNSMAASVVIDGGDSASATAALIFGLDSTAANNNGLFRYGNIPSLSSTAPGTGAQLEIRDCGARGSLEAVQSTNFTQFALFRTSVQPAVRGLLIYQVPGALQPTVHINTLENAGWIQNGATLEVGD